MKFLALLVCILHPILAVTVEPEQWHGKYDKVFPGVIPGPKKLSDKIGIVGAGPAGIHIAYLLKRRGFKNVEILERSNRLGGKSRSIRYRGAIHEMGTCYLSADYEQVSRLANNFTSGETKPPPIASVWSKLTPNGERFDFYYAIKLKLKYPSLNITELQQRFVKKLAEYVLLHKDLFGDYYGEIMPEPSAEQMVRIRGTFKEYLERHDLLDLEELFMASYTLQGYGRISDIPALYGLMWNTPKVILSLIELVNGKPGAIYMLNDGFESLWKNMAKIYNLDITYNTRIHYIHVPKHSERKTTVFYTKRNEKMNYKLHRKRFDFLIWTPPANDFIRVSDYFLFNEEHKLFQGMVNNYYATSLVDDVGARRAQSAVNWWSENIVSGPDMSVWGNRDSYTMFNDLNGANYSQCLTETGNDGRRTPRTSVFYQYSHAKPTRSDLSRILKDHLKSEGATSFNVRAQFNWRYFTRFTEKQTERGYIWRVLDLQGRNKVWFAGASVCFESVKSVVAYNHLLIDRMVKPRNQ